MSQRSSDDLDPYDFSGDEPADLPRYVLVDRGMDFTGDALGPPPVIGAKPRAVEAPGPASGDGLKSAVWSIVEFPFRFLGGLLPGGDGEDDGDQGLGGDDRTAGGRHPGDDDSGTNDPAAEDAGPEND